MKLSSKAKYRGIMLITYSPIIIFLLWMAAISFFVKNYLDYDNEKFGYFVVIPLTVSVVMFFVLFILLWKKMVVNKGNIITEKYNQIGFNEIAYFYDEIKVKSNLLKHKFTEKSNNLFYRYLDGSTSADTVDVSAEQLIQIVDSNDAYLTLKKISENSNHDNMYKQRLLKRKHKFVIIITDKLSHDQMNQILKLCIGWEIEKIKDWWKKEYPAEMWVPIIYSTSLKKIYYLQFFTNQKFIKMYLN